jgi:uncharacterized protein (DUF58 family)
MVLFSDFLGPLEAIETTVKQFSEQGAKGFLLQILDPAEEDLPFHGRTEFEGLEDEGRLIVGRVESLRDDYLRRMADRRQSLVDIARRAGWGFAPHRTDRPPQTALLGLFQALSSGLNSGPHSDTHSGPHSKPGREQDRSTDGGG